MGFGFYERFKDFVSGRNRAASELRTEYTMLCDEQEALEVEAEFHKSPAFLSDHARKTDRLERETRALIYELQEPQRSQLQGRCQLLLEEVERPEAVRVRLGEVRSQLEKLEAGAFSRDDADTVEREAAA